MHVTLHAAQRLSSSLSLLPPQLHHLIDIHYNSTAPAYSPSSSTRIRRFSSTPSTHFFPSSPSYDATSSSTIYPYPSNPRPTPHQIFHLPYGASQRDIKARYYELVRVHHPDSHVCRSLSPGVAQQRFQSITAAYDILRGKALPVGTSHPFSRPDPYAEEIRRRKTAFRRQAEWQHAQSSAGMAGMAWDATRNADDRWKDRLIVLVGIITLAAGLSPGLFYGRQLLEERHLSAVSNLSRARSEARECAEQRRKEMKRRVSEYRLLDALDQDEKMRENSQSTVHGVDVREK